MQKSCWLETSQQQSGDIGSTSSVGTSSDELNTVTMCFSRHEAFDCHKDAFEAMITLSKTTGDVAEVLSKSHTAEKEDNKQLFMKISQNIKFLAHQGIALRGNGSGGDSNFLQLLQLRG